MNAREPDDCPFERYPIPPEVLEDALANFNEAEILEGIREIRETGGHTIDDLLALFDEAATTDERAA